MRKSIGSGLALTVCLTTLAMACAPATKTTRVASASPAEASDAVSTTTLAAAVMESAAAGDTRAEGAVPTACESEGKVKDAKLCVAPRGFAQKLCGGIYPEVALAMFGKGTPWTRLWLAGDVDAWNASGGLTHRAQLAFDEEVIVLSKHGAAESGGIMMTGATAAYDVLRFDGTCVSVMEGELTTRRPPKPKPATLAFHRLEEGTRHALLASALVKSSHAAFEKACNLGDKKSCDKAERGLTQAILEHVRTGASLPEPARRP